MKSKHDERAVIRNLPRWHRAFIDARMLLHVIATGLTVGRRAGIGVRGMARFVRNQLAMAQGFEHCKYVMHDGRVFVDSLTPHSPSGAFDALLRSYLRPAGAPRTFVDFFVLAITNRCMFRCSHCYAVHMLAARDALTLEDLLGVIAELKAMGVGILSIEGGEPLLRFADLLEVLQAARSGPALWMATTGFKLDARQAGALKEAGLTGATISLDHYEPERHNARRGHPKAFEEAARAVSLLRDAGVFPVLAIVPTREMLGDGGLWRFLELARTLGAGMIQVLDPMPSGRCLDDSAVYFRRHELDALIQFQEEANTNPRFRDYPAVSCRAYVEDESRFGCGMGGNQYAYMDASGNVQPCTFLSLSFGNVKADGFRAAYARMRESFPHPLGGPCPVFDLHEKVSRAHAAGATLPLGYRDAAAICEPLRHRGLPRIFAKTGW